MGVLVSGVALAQEEGRMANIGPGEQSHYRVEYLGLKAGTAQITVGAPVTQWGQQVWPLVAVGRSNSVWPIHDRFISYWDSARQRVVGSELHADENRKRRRQRIQMSEDGRKARVLKQKEGEAAEESHHDVPEGALDLAGATYALRNCALEVGKAYTVPIFTGSRTFVMRAQVEAREKRNTLLGERELFRLRVQAELSGKLQTKRDIHVWMTTDPSHVLVRMEADFLLGSIVAELTEYHQGQRVEPAGSQLQWAQGG